MYELVQVSEKCYYINCPAKIGVYIADKDNVYLVDSGNDKDAGRKVRQILDKNGWHLTAILIRFIVNHFRLCSPELKILPLLFFHWKRCVCLVLSLALQQLLCWL